MQVQLLVAQLLAQAGQVPERLVWVQQAPPPPEQVLAQQAWGPQLPELELRLKQPVWGPQAAWLLGQQVPGQRVQAGQLLVQAQSREQPVAEQRAERPQEPGPEQVLAVALPDEVVQVLWLVAVEQPGGEHLNQFCPPLWGQRKQTLVPAQWRVRVLAPQ